MSAPQNGGISLTMANHPLNLALRFALELAGLGALGYWGWTANSGLWQVVVGVGLPLIAAALWGTFRVPNDPGPAPVTVPGYLRLALEAAFFGGAVMGLALAGRDTLALSLGLLVAGHYLVSYDRVRWLLAQR